MTNEKTSAAKKRAASKKQKRLQPAIRQVTEFDPNGIEVTHHRTVDTLGMMLESGAITSGMHAAGRDFQAAFTIACFDSMRSVNLTSIVRSIECARRLGSHRQPGCGPGARGPRARRARWSRLASRLVRLARDRNADVDPRVGASAGLGRTAGSAGKRAGYSGCSARRAREALRHPRRRAPVCMSRIVTWGVRRVRHGGYRAARCIGISSAAAVEGRATVPSAGAGVTSEPKPIYRTIIQRQLLNGVRCPGVGAVETTFVSDRGRDRRPASCRA